MKTFKGFLLISSLLLGGLKIASAQENSPATVQPPKVLVVAREFLKPGRGGMSHEKTESAFVQAFARAKWPTHYLAADSLSGKTRSLFLIGYDSFDAWEKDTLAVQKDATLSAALGRAAANDGELLSDTDGGVFAYHEEYSLRAPVDMPHMRYLEISVFHIRQGHEKDWENLVRLVTPAYDKIPDAHWATYEEIYGGDGNIYVLFTPLKSASEIDQALMQGKQFEAAMGEEGMKKLSELSAAAIDSSQSNLFALNPRMSYVSDDWIKADPDFWMPKPASKPVTAHKKAPQKPGGN